VIPNSGSGSHFWKCRAFRCITMAFRCWRVPYLSYLSSSRVKDTLSHTSTPASSVDKSCCATSQVMPMFLKSCCMVSIQFFRGLPGFLIELLKSQCTACLGVIPNLGSGSHFWNCRAFRCITMALDFSKAFDTVRNATLLEKMAMLDVPDNVYNWFVDYFCWPLSLHKLQR